MTATEASLMPLAMHLGRTRASTINVPAVLASVCSAIPGFLGIGGAVLLLVEPLDGCRISASNDMAAWIGETQLEADRGPLPGALRTGRAMLTADITRIGPPALAAAAAECGLTSSLVVPFGADGEQIGVLQLLGDAYRPVEPEDHDVVRPLLEVLAARLADVRFIRQTMASRTEPKSPPSTGGTGALVPLPRNDAAQPGWFREPARSVDGATSAERPPELQGESTVDTGESRPSGVEATTPVLPALRPKDATGEPSAPSAPVSDASPVPSTMPRAFAPRPTPRPRPGRHSV